MARLSNYQLATRQLALLSDQLAFNPTFREAFEDAIEAPAGTRIAAMREVLKKHGITYPFRIFFTKGESRVQIWAPVTSKLTNKVVNVGYTYRIH